MMRGKASNREHFHSLDALRGIAALCVLVLHLNWATSLTDTAYMRNAHLFVDFFFVLSGFVIAVNYDARIHSAAGAGDFLRLRFWRLYPLHFVMLLVFTALEVGKWYATQRLGMAYHRAAFAHNDLTAFAANLLLVQCFFNGNLGAFDAPSWSISAEFFAYIVFAAVTLAGGKYRTWLAPVFIVLTGAALIWNGDGLNHTNDSLAVVRCLFGFFLGVAVHAVYVRTRVPSALSPAASTALCAAPLVGVAILVALNASMAGEFAMPFLSAAIILALTVTPPNGLRTALSTPPMVWLGKVSYSIYMMHMLAIWAIAKFVRFALHAPFDDVHGVLVAPWIGDLLAVATVALTLALSRFSFSLIEEPWRLWSKRNRPASPTPVPKLASRDA